MQNAYGLKSKVYQGILDMILSEELQPGDRLVEKSLSEKLGVSRIPLREVLQYLEFQGLLEKVPGVGTFVRKYSVKEMIELYELRSYLEGYAARLLCPRMTSEVHDKLAAIIGRFNAAIDDENLPMMGKSDVEFHNSVVKASGNNTLYEIITDHAIQVRTMQMSHVYFTDVPIKNAKQRKYTHEKLLQALSSGDPEQAQHIAVMHVEEFKNNLIKVLTTRELVPG